MVSGEFKYGHIDFIAIANLNCRLKESFRLAERLKTTEDKNVNQNQGEEKNLTFPLGQGVFSR